MRFFLLVMTTSAASAATYYRDRFIPGGVCMVEFAGTAINANMIQNVNVGVHEASEPTGRFWTPYRRVSYESLRVTLVNREYYEIKTDSTNGTNGLIARRDAFLQLIKDTCQ